MNHLFKKEVKIYLKKQELENFLEGIAKQNIYILNIKEVKHDKYKIAVMPSQIELIEAVAKDRNITIEFQLLANPSMLVKLFKKYTPLISAILLSLAILFMLSNIIWEIEIDGVSNDTEIKLRAELAKEGVSEYRSYNRISNTSFLQEKVLEKVPELQWIGIERKGVNYYIQGVEKEEKKNSTENELNHLVARKNGVIQKIDISKGFPEVKINDFVTAGTRLISGLFIDEDSEIDDEEQAPKKIVGAKGKVFARTWYKMKLTIPLTQQLEELTGRTETKYYGKVAGIEAPIWNITKTTFTNIEQDAYTSQLKLFNIKFPISITKLILKEKEEVTLHLTEEEAKTLAIKFVKQYINQRIGPDAKVITENVLHETIVNGKVNLHLFITVEENIAESEPIT